MNIKIPKAVVGLWLWNSYMGGYPAVIIKPVVDACVHKVEPGCASVRENYRRLSWCWATASQECPRDWQLLFNQVVDVIDEQDEQVLCVIPNALVSSRVTPQELKNLRCWALKDGVKPLDKLTDEERAAIPPRINAQHFVSSGSDVLTLIMPWENPADHQVYSSGTQFVRTFNDDHDYYGIYWYNPESGVVQELKIYHDNCYIHGLRSMSERQRDMLAIIDRWAHELVIPYVWGGGSIGCAPLGVPCLAQNSTIAPDAQGWYWKFGLQGPAYGVDCASFVFVAAHIVELPYFYRNTTTLSSHLRPLRVGDSLEDGDLIWFAGHVMLLSDSKNGIITESRGYGIEAGIKTGRVVRRPFTEVLKTFFSGASLDYIDRHGTVLSVPFKILKFASIYRD
jgi:hypothetical protein